jgi:hypothetical protein
MRYLLNIVQTLRDRVLSLVSLFQPVVLGQADELIEFLEG